MNWNSVLRALAAQEMPRLREIWCGCEVERPVIHAGRTNEKRPNSPIAEKATIPHSTWAKATKIKLNIDLNAVCRSAPSSGVRYAQTLRMYTTSGVIFFGGGSDIDYL